MDEEGRFWRAAVMKLLDERIRNAQIRREAPDAANRKRWLKKFGLENLPKALCRAAFFCNFESEDSPEVDSLLLECGVWAYKWTPSDYQPRAQDSRPTYREVLAKLLERMQAGHEGDRAARLYAGVSVAELALEIDKGTVTDALVGVDPKGSILELGLDPELVDRYFSKKITLAQSEVTKADLEPAMTIFREFNEEFWHERMAKRGDLN